MRVGCTGVKRETVLTRYLFGWCVVYTALNSLLLLDLTMCDAFAMRKSRQFENLVLRDIRLEGQFVFRCRFPSSGLVNVVVTTCATCGWGLLPHC